MTEMPRQGTPWLARSRCSPSVTKVKGASGKGQSGGVSCVTTKIWSPAAGTPPQPFVRSNRHRLTCRFAFRRERLLLPTTPAISGADACAMSPTVSRPCRLTSTIARLGVATSGGRRDDGIRRKVIASVSARLEGEPDKGDLQGQSGPGEQFGRWVLASLSGYGGLQVGRPDDHQQAAAAIPAHRSRRQSPTAQMSSITPLA